MGENSIYVLLHNTSRLITLGINKALETNDHIVVLGETQGDGKSVASSLIQHPHVIILEPRKSLYKTSTTIKFLKREFPNAKILCLSVSRDEFLVTQALEAGAEGCIYKTGDPEDLVKAITELVGGRYWLSPEISGSLVQRDRLSAEVDKLLTLREQEIVHLVAKGKSTTEISAALFITAGTIKNHLTRIYSKTNTKSRLKLALWAQRRGLD